MAWLPGVLRYPLQPQQHGVATFYRTLVQQAEGIERLWEVSAPLPKHLTPVCNYDLDSWGPGAGHPLFAPRAWRLPF